MDAFTSLAGMATSTFASTTGISMAQIGAYATSSITHVFIGATLDFLVYNAPKIIAYGLIGICLLVAARAIALWRGPFMNL